MYIQIHDRGAKCEVRSAEGLDRDGHIVEATEPFAVIGEGVVGAAGERGPGAVAERVARRLDRGLDCAGGALEQPLAPGEAESALVGLLEGALCHRIEVPLGMDAREVAARASLGREHFLPHQGPARDDRVPDHPVFPGRKTMPLRKRDVVVGGTPGACQHRGGSEERLAPSETKARISLMLSLGARR